MTTVEAGGGVPAFRVLLIDNRPERRELMRHLVTATGLAAPEVAEAATVADAGSVLDRSDHDVVVLEIQLPVTVGLEAIAALRGRSPELRIVVCSFHREEATKAMALAHGADAYLDKPVSLPALQDVLRSFWQPVPATASTARRRPSGSEAK